MAKNSNRRMSRPAAMGLGVFLVVALIALGWPGVRRARHNAHRRVNVESMMRVAVAKTTYAEAYDLLSGTTVTLQALVSEGLLDDTLEFPGDGRLEVGAIGTYPTLTFRGETITPVTERERRRPMGDS